MQVIYDRHTPGANEAVGVCAFQNFTLEIGFLENEHVIVQVNTTLHMLEI